MMETITIAFNKAIITHRYVNGKAVSELEWEKQVDRTKSPFIKIENNIEKERANEQRK